MGIVVTNLERVKGLCERKAVVVILGAILFGLVHVYDARLIVGTTLLELLLTPLFLKYRNVWPLGVLHGWLGGLFYLWVLNRDLWTEAFG
ncbi:MAG TPA: CPBP family glutamic-type intramembrane protease [Gemmataceae bacterium]|nr:CPBP family glutamic-type intramembrane protease [Gemmataceae bacterium]